MWKMARKVALRLTLFELTMILALAGLEWYSGYRAGVMHHLYVKKRYYLATIYHQSNLIYHLPGLAAGFLIIAFYRRQNDRIITKVSLLRYTTVLLLLLLCYLLPWFHQLNIFAHLLLVLEGCLILEAIRLLFLQSPRR